MRITSKGQVTIPEPIRRQAGMLPGTEVEFVLDQTGVRLCKTEREERAGSTARDRKLAEALDRLSGSAPIRMTTEEIMALTRGE